MTPPLSRGPEPGISGSDRRVHARLRDGSEVVRYDRAGKWWIEGTHGRCRASLSEAARRAAVEGVEINFGLPGGKLFDAAARQSYA